MGFHLTCGSAVCLVAARIGDVPEASEGTGRACGQDGNGCVTEEQLKALARAKEEKQAWCEIETENVGYLRGEPRTPFMWERSRV